MKRTTVYTMALATLLSSRGAAVLAEDIDEVERLRAQVEALKEQAEKQQKVISIISQRLEKIENTDAKAGTNRISKKSVPDSELERLAGRGTSQTDNSPPPASTESAPAQGEEEVVKEAGPSQSVRDVLREEHTLFNQRLTLEPGFTYSYSDRSQLALSGFLALDAIFLGQINVDTVESHIMTLDMNARYGFSDRLEAEVNAPFIYRESTYQSIGVGGSTTQSSEVSVDETGLGDISAALYYRLFRETQTTPDVVVNIGFRAPTGSDPFGIPTQVDPVNNNVTFPSELPTGNGVWGVTGGVSVLKTIDPAIVFANAGYTYNIEESFDDINATSGNQPGDVKLGDAIRFGFGTAFALNERFSLSLSYSHQYSMKSEVTQNGVSQRIIGSDANVGVMNFGATYALNNSTSIVSNIGLGLTNDASDIAITFRVPMQF
ncbi:hypothetical protein J2T55_000990 [Methylohalomonas lacus]|uniref:Transporter n=1 Tax=Methylohalomonas lacus TaxID=398773 RepID=A0AAE3L5A3_9GAMM|nr:transporter [Methylohalomonas lacus]MCS3902982.1 hypothetical protein [Methylohalomonas lacus]